MLRARIHKYRNGFFLFFSNLVDVYERELFGTFVFCLTIFSFLFFFGIIFWGFFTYVIIVMMAIHTIIYAKASSRALKSENYPYETLRSLNTSFIVLVLSAFTALFVFSVVIAASLVLGLPALDSPFMLMLGVVFDISISLIIPSSLMSLSDFRFSYHKESRLGIKLLLSVLQSVMNEQPQIRDEIVTKNARWFKGAFHSINSFLMEKPFKLELKNLESYHDAVYTIALLGTLEEIKQTYQNIQSILDNIGEEISNVKLRKLMIAISQLMRKDIDEETPATEISPLWRTTTFWDRIQLRLRSPIAALAVAIVAIIVAIVFGILSVML